ncbi:GH3 auxin-responsive promoter family protein [Okeanomitos corallinicola TIOX110]|uniref:GH3 auxin-responsive promoter family protein n=1 Tax=Okeanomitos corallinicola TIOX110 TaxID=3133117 RepID=A0ABZ2UTD0_9CYAN
MIRPIIQLFAKTLTPTANRFYQSLSHPELTQKSVKQEICNLLINSEYGKSLNMNSLDDWQHLPIVDYDDIAHHLQYQNKQIALTPEPILFYEKTSGSSGAIKYIPYTQSLRTSFNQMFCVWVHDLITNGPKFNTGKLYACISPQLNLENQTLQDDLDYLDPWLRWFLRLWLVIPDKMTTLKNTNSFQHQLALALLKAENLETISIWSPSFLQVQLKYIQENRDFLKTELKKSISSQRLKLLDENNINWVEIWQDLKLISCWDSANAADQAQGLKNQFPGVLVQGKGLLATEAPMTIPLIKAGGYVPILDQVFFEFEDDDHNIYNLHELNVNQEYKIILSQKGGLYRYRIGDRIKVTHYHHNTPCLQFIGRNQTTSDLVGEKLPETFVKNALEKLNLQNTNFKSLVPISQPPHYILLLDSATETPEKIAQKLDQSLSKSYHYQRARTLGQLTEPEVFISESIPEILVNYHLKNGGVWGGIKHQILVKLPMSIELLQAIKNHDHQNHL